MLTIDQGEIRIENLLTEDMLADILTMPLQGQLHQRARKTAKLGGVWRGKEMGQYHLGSQLRQTGDCVVGTFNGPEIFG